MKIPWEYEKDCNDVLDEFRVLAPQSPIRVVIGHLLIISWSNI